MTKGNIRSGVAVLFLYLAIAFLISLYQLAIAAEGGNGAASLVSSGLTIALDSEEQAWLNKHTILRVGGPMAFPPFHFIDQDGNAKGMAFDYLHFIMGQLGLKIEVRKDLSWPEVLEKAKAKEIDVIPCAAQSREREAYLLFSKPYLSFPLVIISRKDSPFIGGLDDLRGLKVTFIKENAVYEWLKSDRIDVIPQFVGTPLEALRAVSGGLAEAHIENLAAASYLIEKYGLANLKVAAPTSYQNYSLHFAVRKDWPELLSIINKALVALSPEQQAMIRNNWLSVRYEYGISLADVWKWIFIIVVPVSVALTVISFWNRRLRREITERKRAEDALRESEEMLRQLFDNMAEGVVIYQAIDDGGDFTFVDINRKGQLLSSISRKDAIGRRVTEVFPAVKSIGLLEAFRRAWQTGDAQHHPSVLYDDGRVQRWVENYVFKLPSGLVVALYSDTSEKHRAEEERKTLQERLHRAEKMEALGTLAGGVAHDLNNVLGIVVGYSELLLADLDESSSARSEALQIFKGGQRAAAMVQDLLTLARRGVPSRKVLNLNNIVMECQQSPEFAQMHASHPNMEVKTDLEPDLLNILGSSLHLAKSVFNLVFNAAEAMPNGGTLTIMTRNQYLDKPVSGFDEVKEGDCVVLSLSDTGEGISASDLKRIFEPFYTKKVMGRSGTGLGLAVVWGTVKDHGGYINVESEEGKGTTFTLYFPVIREDITLEKVSISAAEYMGNGESILIVDDVKEQQELAARMLTKLSYRVATVSSGEEAVDHVRDHAVDLVVLDMIMDPGMDGLDTYAKILEMHPRQKAIIVSGFSETERVSKAQALGAGSYVKKPYVMEKLGLAVRRELDKPA